MDYTRNLVSSLARQNYQKMSELKIISTFTDILKLNPDIMEIVLMNARGQEVVKISSKNGRCVSQKNLMNRKKREEFYEAKNKNYYISPVLFSALRLPYQIISCRGNGNVLLVKLNLENIWELISEIEIGKRGYAFVVDNTGILIAHPHKERVIAHTDFANLSIVKNFLNHRKKTSWEIYNDEKGERVASLYGTIPELNWAVIAQLPYSEVRKPAKEMIFQSVLWSIVFSGLFLFLGIKFVSGLLNPLAKLRNFVGKISEGKFDTRIKINSGDEIEELANAFNSMAESLRKLEELRQDLISMVVHDLKSPLSGVIGSIDYLLSTGKDIKEQKEIISIIKNSVDSLLGIIQNLLDISRMEEDKLELRKENIELKTFLQGTAEQFTLLTQVENKQFSVNYEGAIPNLRIDSQIIKRVLNNLLHNSLCHTTSHGKIWLNIKNINNNTIQFEVEDNGSGVPEEYKTKIFEKFVQVERKRAHLRTGTGLGLTFCKMAIELHGGKIWVESPCQPEGAGSKFSFTLPIDN